MSFEVSWLRRCLSSDEQRGDKDAHLGEIEWGERAGRESREEDCFKRESGTR